MLIVLGSNLFLCQTICFNFINLHCSESKSWQPTITIKQILLGVQDLLNHPNNDDPAQREPHQLLQKSKAQYEARIRAEAKKHTPL